MPRLEVPEEEVLPRVDIEIARVLLHGVAQMLGLFDTETVLRDIGALDVFDCGDVSSRMGRCEDHAKRLTNTMLFRLLKASVRVMYLL
jgi:hypothetical protein